MGANLSDLVRAAAAEHPDTAAIISAGRRTTWAELERLLRAVSGGLAARRLDRGDRVAIVVGNSLEFVTSYFGTLRAGLVAVPINTAYTAAEISEVLRSSGAKLAIADAASAAAVNEAAGDVPVVEVGTDAWRRLTVGSTPPPTDQTDAESLAVLLYTAGTSGKPKGAMLTHRAMLANLDQISQSTNPALVETDDIALIVLPLFHIYALNAALGMVAKVGATAVLTDRFEPHLALDLIRHYAVTNVAGAPPMYLAWSSDPDIAEKLSGIRILASGAAPLLPNVFQQFQTAGLTIWEGYGMAEASPVIATTAASGRPKPGFVGQPLTGIEVKLVDESGQDVQDGDPGEIVIRGANLFSGYWPDGADGPDSDGWFATGDVAIADEEGDLRLVDRRGDLILVSGFNVYPREIEAELSLAPGVAEVAVFGVGHPYTGEAVKAMVVARAGVSISPDEIVAFASMRLARFKMPTIVEIVKELPHSVTGKVMKGSLRENSTDVVVESVSPDQVDDEQLTGNNAG